MITIKEALTKKVLRDFFYLPIWLYKGNKHNVPALIVDEKEEFNPLINGAFEFCIARKFVAYKDGKPVGRIAGIFNQKYNIKQGVKQIRFTRFDCIDDIEVARALINKIKEWAVFLGMDEIIGPIGFSDLDKQGMLIEGFDELDLYITIYNYPYYPKLLEQLGFSKAVDWVEYEIKVPEKMDERIERISDLVQKRYGYEYLKIKKFKDIEPYIMEALLVVMNEAFEPLFGVAPINERQAKRQAQMLKMIFKPDFVSAVMKDAKLVGYSFMAPNISNAIKKCNGKLNLCGLISLMRSLKKFDKVDFYHIAVRQEYQSKGVNAMILSAGLKALIKNKVKYVYTGPELENNLKVRSQWDDFEKRIYRRRRCYTLSLSNSN